MAWQASTMAPEIVQARRLRRRAAETRARARETRDIAFERRERQRSLHRQAIHVVLQARRRHRVAVGFVYASDEADSIAPGLQAIVESTGMPVLVSDADGRIAFWNHAIADLFGYDFDEFGALRLHDLLPDRLRAVHDAHTERYFRQPRFRSIESGVVVTGRHHDGSEIALDVSLGPLTYDEELYVMASVRPHLEAPG